MLSNHFRNESAAESNAFSARTCSYVSGDIGRGHRDSFYTVRSSSTYGCTAFGWTLTNVEAIIEIACQTRGWSIKGKAISFTCNLTVKRLSLTLEFVLFPQNFLELPLSDTVNFLWVLYLRKEYYHSFCRHLSLQGRGWTYFNISTKHFCRVRINSSKKTINIIFNWGCLQRHYFIEV